MACENNVWECLRLGGVCARLFPCVRMSMTCENDVCECLWRVRMTCHREWLLIENVYDRWKRSPRYSKELRTKSLDLEIQIFEVWSPPWVEKRGCVSKWKKTYIHEKNTIYKWKETYIHEKNPTYMTPTGHVWVSFHMSKWKETYIHEKNPIYMTPTGHVWVSFHMYRRFVEKYV